MTKPIQITQAEFDAQPKFEGDYWPADRDGAGKHTPLARDEMDAQEREFAEAFGVLCDAEYGEGGTLGIQKDLLGLKTESSADFEYRDKLRAERDALKLRIDEYANTEKPFQKGARLTDTEPPTAPATETKEQRQDRRLQMCIDAGLEMPRSEHGRLPDGVGDVADAEGVRRQSFSPDVKEALARKIEKERPKPRLVATKKH